jgi:hypothetical protein
MRSSKSLSPLSPLAPHFNNQKQYVVSATPRSLNAAGRAQPTASETKNLENVQQQKQQKQENKGAVISRQRMDDWSRQGLRMSALGPDIWGMCGALLVLWSAVSSPSSIANQARAKMFFQLLTCLLPCVFCRNSFMAIWQTSRTPRGEAMVPFDEYWRRNRLEEWWFAVHNAVNAKLDKPQLPWGSPDVIWSGASMAKLEHWFWVSVWAFAVNYPADIDLFAPIDCGIGKKKQAGSAGSAGPASRRVTSGGDYNDPRLRITGVGNETFDKGRQDHRAKTRLRMMAYIVWFEQLKHVLPYKTARDRPFDVSGGAAGDNSLGARWSRAWFANPPGLMTFSTRSQLVHWVYGMMRACDVGSMSTTGERTVSGARKGEVFDDEDVAAGLVPIMEQWHSLRSPFVGHAHGGGRV